MSRRSLPPQRRHELERLAAAARAQGRPHAETAAHSAAVAGITRLWAWRLATGWTRTELLGRLRQLGATAVDESMLWRWESGDRAPWKHYLDWLCQVYQTRPDLLGYGHDYTPADAAAAPHGLDPGRRPTSHPRSATGGEDPMRRTYLTTAQAAKRLHVSPKTISRWAQEGRLEHLRTLGGHRRFDPAYIDQLAQQLTEPATHPDQ